jgi:hypothetical protein
MATKCLKILGVFIKTYTKKVDRVLLLYQFAVFSGRGAKMR